MSIRFLIGKLLLLIPIIKNKQFVYEILGVNKTNKSTEKCKFFIANPKVIGSYENISINDEAQVNQECLLIAKDKIVIGKNTGIAYGVTIITSANPSAAKHVLGKIYPPLTAPVIIGNNCWIGANSTILPGVSIGDNSVVAAGSVVTKDVPSCVLVAGCPAIVKKKLLI